MQALTRLSGARRGQHAALLSRSRDALLCLASPGALHMGTWPQPTARTAAELTGPLARAQQRQDRPQSATLQGSCAGSAAHPLMYTDALGGGGVHQGGNVASAEAVHGMFRIGEVAPQLKIAPGV